MADHVRALLLAGSSKLPRPVAVYNVGTGTPITVKALGRVDFGARPLGPHEPPEMYADASLIARDLGYTAAVDLRDGLRRTIAAYRAHALSGEPGAQRAAP